MDKKITSMNRKLAIIADDFPSEGRHVFVFVQQLVFAMVDQGADITVIAPQSLTHALFRGEKLRSRKSVELTVNGKQFCVYRPYSMSFGVGHKWLYKIAAKFNRKNLTKCLESVNPDIIYGHFWHSAYKAIEFALKFNLPVFVACGEGDDALEELVKGMTIDEKEQFSKMVNGVICVSSENKRKCLQYGLSREENTIVLPNCVDDTLFHPDDETSLREDLGINDNDFVVSFSGAFIKRKGTKILSDAIKKLSDTHIKSIFMGRLVEGDKCEPDCPGIVYKGSTEHSLMPRYLNASDVFVLPTQNEGCSNAIVEALACGIPVISSNRPFNDDILNENNSILIDPDSVDEVAEAILQMKNNKELYAQKKHYAIHHSREYSIVERARKIIAFINDKLDD
ncbi:glycosyltransferase family 4 protein [Xylanibacter ruminicola]|nr:glycosyltransferase family 4 protein [Xylanibacter ruminicola]